MGQLASNDSVVNGLHEVMVGGRTSYGATVAFGLVVTVGLAISVVYVVMHRPKGEAAPAWAAAAGCLLLDSGVIYRLLAGPAPRFGGWWHFLTTFAGFALVNLSVVARLYRWRLHKMDARDPWRDRRHSSRVPLADRTGS